MTFKWLQLFFNPMNRDLRHVYLRRNGIASKTVFRMTKHLCFSTVTSQNKFDLLKYVPRQCKITEKVKNCNVTGETYVTSSLKKRRNYTVTAGYAAKRRSKRFPFSQMWKEWVPDYYEVPAKCTQARGMSKKPPSRSDQEESWKLRRDVKKKDETGPTSVRRATKSRHSLWTNATARALSRENLRTKSEITLQEFHARPATTEKPKRLKDKGLKRSAYHLKVNPHTGKLDVDEFDYEDVLIKRAKNYIDNGGQIREFPCYINDALKLDGRNKHHKVIHNLAGSTVCNRFSIHRSRPSGGGSDYHSRGMRSYNSKAALKYDEKFNMKRLRACQAKHCLTNLQKSEIQEGKPPPEVYTPSCKWKSKNRIFTKYMTEEDAYKQAAAYLKQFNRSNDDNANYVPNETPKRKVSLKTKTLPGYYPSRDPIRKPKELTCLLGPRTDCNGPNESGGSKGSSPSNQSSRRGNSVAWFATGVATELADATLNPKKTSNTTSNPNTFLDSSYVTNTNKIYKKKQYILRDVRDMRDDTNLRNRPSILTNVINILPRKRNMVNLIHNRHSFCIDLRNADTVNNIDLSSKHSSGMSTALPKMKGLQQNNSGILNSGDPEIATRSNFEALPPSKPVPFMRSYIPVLRRRRIKHSKMDPKRNDVKQHGRKLYNLQDFSNAEGEANAVGNNVPELNDPQLKQKCDECAENTNGKQVQSNVDNNTQQNEKELQNFPLPKSPIFSSKLNKTWNMDQAIANRKISFNDRWMQPPEKDNLALNPRNFLRTPTRWFSSAADEILHTCQYCGTVHGNDDAVGCPIREAIKLFKADEKASVPFKLITLPSIVNKCFVKQKKGNPFVPFPISKRTSRNQILFDKPLIGINRKGNASARLRAAFKDQPRLKSYSTFKPNQQDRRAKQQNMRKFKQNLRKLLGDLLQDCNQSFKWTKNVKIIQGQMHFVIQEGNKRVNVNIPCGQPHAETHNSNLGGDKSIMPNKHPPIKPIYGSRERPKIKKHPNTTRFLHQEYNSTKSDKQEDNRARKQLISKKKSGTRNYNTCCKFGNLKLPHLKDADNNVMSDKPRFSNPQAEESYRKYKAMLEITQRAALKQSPENSEINLHRKVNSILIPIPRKSHGNPAKMQKVKCNITQHNRGRNAVANKELIQLFPRREVRENEIENTDAAKDGLQCIVFKEVKGETAFKDKASTSKQDDCKVKSIDSGARSIRSRSLSRAPRSVVVRSRNHSCNEPRNETVSRRYEINNDEASKPKEKVRRLAKLKETFIDDKNLSIVKVVEEDKNDRLKSRNLRKELIASARAMESQTVNKGRVLMLSQDDKKQETSNQIVKNASSKQLNDFPPTTTLSTRTNFSAHYMFVPAPRFFTSQSKNEFSNNDCPAAPTINKKLCPKFCYRESASKTNCSRNLPDAEEEDDCKEEASKYTRERKLCAKTDNFKAVMAETLHLTDCCELDHIQARLKRQNKRMAQENSNDKCYDSYQGGTHASKSHLMLCEEKALVTRKESCEEVRDKRTLMDFISDATAKIQEFIKPLRKSSESSKVGMDKKSMTDAHIEPGKRLECKPNWSNLKERPSAHSDECMSTYDKNTCERELKDHEYRRKARSKTCKREDVSTREAKVQVMLGDKKEEDGSAIDTVCAKLNTAASKEITPTVKKSRSDSNMIHGSPSYEEFKRDRLEAHKIIKERSWEKITSNAGKNVYAIKGNDIKTETRARSRRRSVEKASKVCAKNSDTNSYEELVKHPGSGLKDKESCASEYKDIDDNMIAMCRKFNDAAKYASEKFSEGPKFYRVCRELAKNHSKQNQKDANNECYESDDTKACRESGPRGNYLHRKHHGHSKMKLCKKYSDANIHAASVKFRKGNQSTGTKDNEQHAKNMRPVRKLCADGNEALQDNRRLKQEKIDIKRILEQVGSGTYNIATNRQEFEARLYNKYNANTGSSNVILETVEPTHYKVRTSLEGIQNERLIFGNGPACPPTIMKPICSSKFCYIDPNENRQCPIGNAEPRTYESKHLPSPKSKNHKKVCKQNCVAKDTHDDDAKSSRCSTLAPACQTEKDPTDQELSYLSQNQMNIICQQVIAELQSRGQLKISSDDICPHSTVNFAPPSQESPDKWTEEIQNCVKKCLDSNFNTSKASIIVTKTCETSKQLSQCLQNVRNCLDEYRKCLEEFDKIPRIGSVLSVPSFRSQEVLQESVDNSLHNPRLSQSHTGFACVSCCTPTKPKKEPKSPSMNKMTGNSSPRYFHACADSNNISNESSDQNKECLPGTYLVDKDIVAIKAFPTEIMVQEPIVNMVQIQSAHDESFKQHEPPKVSYPTHTLRRNEPDIGSIGRNYGNSIESYRYRQHCMQKINDIITNNIRFRNGAETNEAEAVENTYSNRAAICVSREEFQLQLTAGNVVQECNKETVSQSDLIEQPSTLASFTNNLTDAYPMYFSQVPVPSPYDQGASCPTPRKLPFISTKRTLIANTGTRRDTICKDHKAKECINFIDKKTWNSKTKTVRKGSVRDTTFHHCFWKTNIEKRKSFTRKENLPSNNPQYGYCHLHGSSEMKNNDIVTLFESGTSSRLM